MLWPAIPSFWQQQKSVLQPSSHNQMWNHSVCVASSPRRRVGRWVERIASGKGETERKSGVKDTLSVATGIFRRYSDGCWASSFPRSRYK